MDLGCTGGRKLICITEKLLPNVTDQLRIATETLRPRAGGTRAQKTGVKIAIPRRHARGLIYSGSLEDFRDRRRVCFSYLYLSKPARKLRED